MLKASRPMDVVGIASPDVGFVEVHEQVHGPYKDPRAKNRIDDNRPLCEISVGAMTARLIQTMPRFGSPVDFHTRTNELNKNKPQEAQNGRPSHGKERIVDCYHTVAKIPAAQHLKAMDQG